MRRAFSVVSAASLLAFVAAAVAVVVIDSINSAHRRQRNAKTEAQSERILAVQREIRAVETAAPPHDVDLERRNALLGKRKRLEDEQARFVANTGTRRFSASLPKRSPRWLGSFRLAGWSSGA